MKYSIILLSLGLTIQTSLQAGAFTNLDFESANTNNITGGDGIFDGTTKDLIPGWTVQDKSGAEKTTIFFNSETPGGIPFAILEMKNPNYSFSYDGQYGLTLVSTSVDPLFLSQTGTIPSDSKYITFLSEQHVSLSIDGNRVQLDEVPVWKLDPHYPNLSMNLAWADVSLYAGQEVTLAFGSDVQNQSFGCGVDNIQFSSTLLVPEPSTVVLFGLGGLAFLGRRMQSRKKRDAVFF